MSKTFDLSFIIDGKIKQTIEILDPNYTKEDIINGLNDGYLVTHIHENFAILDISDNDRDKWTEIARIVEIDDYADHVLFEELEEGEVC